MFQTQVSTESWNNSEDRKGLEQTSKITQSPPPCHGQGHHHSLDQVVQGLIQCGYKHRQAWGRHNFPYQPVPVPRTLTVKNFSLKSRLNPSFSWYALLPALSLQLLTRSPSPAPCSPCKVPMGLPHSVRPRQQLQLLVPSCSRPAAERQPQHGQPGHSRTPRLGLSKSSRPPSPQGMGQRGAMGARPAATVGTTCRAEGATRHPHRNSFPAAARGSLRAPPPARPAPLTCTRRLHRRGGSAGQRAGSRARPAWETE